MVTPWAIALSIQASAWTPIGATWDAQPVPYWIAADLGPFSEDEGDELRAVAAIHAAFATWSSVDCTSARFLYEGRVSAPLMAADGRNVVTLVGDSWPAAAPTFTQLTLDGTRIVEADVALDAQTTTWVTRGADGITALDLQAGLVAEVGHLLGLGDSDVADATMNPLLSGTVAARNLSEDDIEGVCSLYPSLLPGAGALGEPCVGDDTCEEDLECVFDATETYCAPSCPTGGCPDGYTCLGFEGRRVCVRGGCGCATSGPAAGWLAGVGGLLVRYRRRPHPSRPVRGSEPPTRSR